MSSKEAGQSLATGDEGGEVAAVPETGGNQEVRQRRDVRKGMKSRSAMHVMHNDGDVEDGKGKWYRLQSKKKFESAAAKGGSFLGCLESVLCLGAVGVGDYNSIDGARWCPNPHSVLQLSLFWITRTSFPTLFLLSSVVFFFWIIFFAALIIAAGVADRDCPRIGGEPFAFNGTDFADAFGLSWTTISTVGYGSSYPALGHEAGNKNNCAGITVVCSIESFVGVLYAGFVGAILFGKVLRIQSIAQVLFSHPIVIRFGIPALTSSEYRQEEEDDDDDDDDDEEEEAPVDGGVGQSRKVKIPCPVLEFRIVNRLSQQEGGEIMDASINCVANVNVEDAASVINEADKERMRQTLMKYDHKHGHKSLSHLSSHSENEGGESEHPRAKHGFVDVARALGHKRDHHTIEEDPTLNLAPRRIFSKLVIEAENHPFFKRVWLCRHVLNETSPILTPQTRKMIRKNGGHWPQELNNAAGIRKSVRFNQILVSLSGVSNVSAASVFAQKVYDFVDVVVGYQFVNLLYRGGDGSVRVDLDLVNDVIEQRGGGAEVLFG